jgi:arsenate reductase (glutaredoxin)
MAKLKLYSYDRCSTCRKSIQFLKKKEVDFDVIPILENPPGLAALKKMLKFKEGELKKLFNSSGQQYREMKLSEKLRAGLSQDDALELLSKNGKLVKRPFLLLEDHGLLGFKEEEWKKFF